MRDFLLGVHPEENSFNAESASPEERVFHAMTEAVGELFNDKPLTVQNMTSEQIFQMYDALIEIEGGNVLTDFDNYFNEKYGN